MVSESKKALGKVTTLNEYLLDIDGFYFNKGDMFGIALDDYYRVIGSADCNLLPDSEAVIHRLYIKYCLKRQELRTKLLGTDKSFPEKTSERS